MKSTLPSPMLLMILFLAGSLCAAPAQNGQPPLRGAMVPGQPVPPPPAAVSPAPTGVLPAFQNQPFPAIDPMTGLPIPQFEWKDPNWEDPNKLVKEINYPDLPMTEVANDLRKLFEDAFDMLLPHDFENQGRDSQAVNWLETKVTLQLKNVKASEIFNAMNLLFENNRTPLRWELKMNGTRRTALLRVLESPRVGEAAGRPLLKRVYFVGDIADENYGGMGMSSLVSTIADVWNMAYGEPNQAGTIQFHKKAQLLIVTGTADQVDFVQATLQELRRKAESEHARRQVEMNRKNMEPKPGGDGPAGK